MQRLQVQFSNTVVAGGEERTLQTDRTRLGCQSGGAEECCPLVGALQLIMQVCSLLLCFGSFSNASVKDFYSPPTGWSALH